MEPEPVLPTVAEIELRIRSCEEELAALRRLRRLAKAAVRAEQARRQRWNNPTMPAGARDTTGGRSHNQ